MARPAKVARPGKASSQLGAWGCQVNLEFLAVDRRVFVTDQERALEHLFGDGAVDDGGNSVYKQEISVIAQRLVTFLASVKASGAAWPVTSSHHEPARHAQAETAPCQSLQAAPEVGPCRALPIRGLS
jgi:hypothetical protein